jgi:hypothetical protein
VLNGVCQRRGIHETKAKEIAAAAHQQLQLAQDVVLTVEQISRLAKKSRDSAESACWTMRSLTQTTPHFKAVIDRLQGCADVSDLPPASAELKGERSDRGKPAGDGDPEGTPAIWSPPMANTDASIQPV